MAKIVAVGIPFKKPKTTSDQTRGRQEPKNYSRYKINKAHNMALRCMQANLQHAKAASAVMINRFGNGHLQIALI